MTKGQLAIQRAVTLPALLLLLAFSGCSFPKATSPSQERLDLKFGSEYQAVLLTNGQVFFGKIEGLGTPYPSLRDVYYVQTVINEKVKKSSNILVRRGNEWHSPDRMYLNATHIVLIEPVGKDSQVAKLIAESKTKQ
ncbi:MAG: hypothetical protein HY234_04055 [Acidobacteria bacterium]|nr:hypothetical protein [Acidobacteriota bacterium]